MLNALEKACGGDWMVCRVMSGFITFLPVGNSTPVVTKIKEFDGTGDVLERERERW